MSPDDIILMDIKRSEKTLGDVLRAWPVWVRQHPDRQILMDGDKYAIVARKKVSA